MVKNKRGMLVDTPRRREGVASILGLELIGADPAVYALRIDSRIEAILRMHLGDGIPACADAGVERVLACMERVFVG